MEPIPENRPPATANATPDPERERGGGLGGDVCDCDADAHGGGDGHRHFGRERSGGEIGKHRPDAPREMPTRAKYIAVRTMPFRKPSTGEDLRVPAGQAVPTEGQLPPDSSAGEV